MARRRSIGFEAPLVAGHKGVTVVIAPFDPREAWGEEPTPLDARREGWLVAGTVNGVAFEGWIGFRWGRFFVMIDPALRAAAGIAVGDAVEVAIAPTRSATALAIARRQAELTTAPKRRPQPKPAVGARPRADRSARDRSAAPAAGRRSSRRRARSAG